MVKWQIYSGGKENWNQMLEGQAYPSPFQLFDWGEVKAAQGWSIARFSAVNSGKTESMVQILYRKVGGVLSIAWIPGGPTGNLLLGDSEFLNILKQHLTTPLVYVRMNSMRPASGDSAAQMREVGWRPCSYKMGSGMSMLLNFSKTADAETQNMKHYSSNWRHNVKRAQKKEMSVRPERASTDEIRRLYLEMEDYKALNTQYTEGELKLILEKVTTGFNSVCVYSKENVLLSFRACIKIGSWAWDFLAATSPEGRKIYASYFATHELFQKCRGVGVENYDMMGIDKENNPGVYTFKKGTGAEDLHYLGEWDLGNVFGLRWICNILIKYKMRGRV